MQQKYSELIRRRLEGCPVAYLVGRKEFFGLELKVSPAVLIPRPDTEHVVMECLKLAKPMDKPRILDIGTGSGDLAIAIAKHHPTADVTAIDASAEPSQSPRKTRPSIGVDRIRFLDGDLFAPLAADEQFDFIVSNPPYIADEEMAKLPVGVRQYEPHDALKGGPGGFAVFDRLIAERRRAHVVRRPSHRRDRLAVRAPARAKVEASPSIGCARQSTITPATHASCAETVPAHSGGEPRPALTA